MSIVLGGIVVPSTTIVPAGGSTPMLGYHNIVTAFNITSNGEAADHPSTALANPLTYDSWKSTATPPAVITVALDDVAGCDYIGMAGLAGAVSVKVECSDDGGATWSTALSETDITGLSVIMLPFDYAEGDVWRVTLGGSSITASVLFLGQALRMERCIMKTYAPLPYNRVTKFNTNMSENGQFLGRSITRGGQKSGVSFSMMTAPWVRGRFQDFVRHARTKPYFFSWKPEVYPKESAYVSTDSDIGVSYTGQKNYMTAEWEMQGLGWNEQE